MSKYIKILFALSVILAFAIMFAQTAHASDCISSSWVNIAGNGVPAKLNVTNKASCGPKEVSFCSYRVYIRPSGAGWLSTQTLFDSQVITLQPGQTVTMSVKTDTCMNQVDAFEGPCVYPFTSDSPSLPTIFAGSMTSFTTDLCTKCTDECTVDSQRVCDGRGWKQCSKGSDGCYHWGPKTDCDSDQKCVNGSCTDIDICSETLSGSPSSAEQQLCANAGGVIFCGNGWCKCNCEHAPTVDLTVSGSVSCNHTATLSWTTTHATACTASGAWSGSKATSGSESVGNFTGSRTYTLTCTGNGGTASDSVTLEGTSEDLEVSAGPDKEIDEDEDSVRLDGSVDGEYDDVSWSCTGGSLSDRNILRPEFRAPWYNDDYFGGDYDSDYYDRTYTCTLTAHNECGSDSDSMRVTVNREPEDFNVSLTAYPRSECAPLDGVDLTARVTNYGSYGGDYTYRFDCDNDGDWEKTATTDETEYTAYNLCDYRNPGTYTARVRVESRNRTATDTETIEAEDCYNYHNENGRVSITKTVADLNANTGYQASVTANPGDTVSYKIIVAGVTGCSDNVTVTDTMPNGIVSAGSAQLDGYACDGSLASSINLGRICAGQTKIITYTGLVAEESYFGWGQNTLTNVARVTVDGAFAESRASVYVYRQAVQGATIISTGFKDDVLPVLLAAGAILLLAACLLRKRIANLFTPDPRKKLGEKIQWVRQRGW